MCCSFPSLFLPTVFTGRFSERAWASGRARHVARGATSLLYYRCHWSFSFLLFKNPFKRSHSLFCLIIIPISCHRWSLNKVCSCLPRNPRPRVDRPRRHPLHGGPPRKQRRRGPARDRLVRPARAQPGRVRLLVGRRQELEEDQVRSLNIITMSQYVFLVMG